MPMATLRTVGGSVMVAIPKPILEGLGLAANEKVALRVEDGKLVMEPRSRPKYTLAELIARCDPDAPIDEADAKWDAAPPVGREIV